MGKPCERVIVWVCLILGGLVSRGPRVVQTGPGGALVPHNPNVHVEGLTSSSSSMSELDVCTTRALLVNNQHYNL